MLELLLRGRVWIRLKARRFRWKIQRPYDEEVYTWRHLVENSFAKIKEFRGIAMRYDKTDSSYAANWNLVAAPIASR